MVDDNNIITTRSMQPKKAAPKPKPKPAPEPVVEQVAVYSPNALWHSGVGRLEAGYTVLSVEDADKWIAISSKVRKASPQEVASAFGA